MYKNLYIRKIFALIKKLKIIDNFISKYVEKCFFYNKYDGSSL